MRAEDEVLILRGIVKEFCRATGLMRSEEHPEFIESWRLVHNWQAATRDDDTDDISKTNLYRKKPIVVRAMKWTGDNITEIADLVPDEHMMGLAANGVLTVDTVDGNECVVPIGAYVVIDSKGYPYPHEAETFEQNHEPVEVLAGSPSEGSRGTGNR